MDILQLLDAVLLPILIPVISGMAIAIYKNKSAMEQRMKETIDQSMKEADVRQLIEDKLAVTTYAQQQLTIRLTHIEQQLDKILERLSYESKGRGH